MFEDKEDGIGSFNTFGGVTGFTSTLCEVGKFVCCIYFQSHFVRARSESVEIVFRACNSVDHRGSGGKDGPWLIVAIVSSWVPMWR